MGFATGPPDNTVRIAMTIPTQIRNQPFVSHMFLTFQISTRQSSAASATAERVAATIHELQPTGGRRVFLSKARSFASNRPSLFPCPLRCALQAWLELEPRFFCARLLQPQQSRIQWTHAAYTTSRGHCPSSRRVRLSHTTLNVIPYSTIALRTSRV